MSDEQQDLEELDAQKRRSLAAVVHAQRVLEAAQESAVRLEGKLKDLERAVTETRKAMKAADVEVDEARARLDSAVEANLATVEPPNHVVAHAGLATGKAAINRRHRS